jgi:hypothetical protein
MDSHQRMIHIAVRRHRLDELTDLISMYGGFDPSPLL